MEIQRQAEGIAGDGEGDLELILRREPLVRLDEGDELAEDLTYVASVDFVDDEDELFALTLLVRRERGESTEGAGHELIGHALVRGDLRAEAFDEISVIVGLMERDEGDVAGLGELPVVGHQLVSVVLGGQLRKGATLADGDRMLGGNVGLPGARRPEEDEVRGFGFHKFIRGGQILGGEEQGAHCFGEGFVVEQFDGFSLKFG